MTPSRQRWTDEELAELVDLLCNSDAGLTPEEVAEYERCQQSVIDARRAAERDAHKFWIG